MRFILDRLMTMRPDRRARLSLQKLPAPLLCQRQTQVQTLFWSTNLRRSTLRFLPRSWPLTYLGQIPQGFQSA